jgi:hypothetical protein
MTIKEIITAKATSGKYFLTVIAGLVFAYASYAKLLDSQAISVIVTAVFISYFNRQDKPTEVK